MLSRLPFPFRWCATFFMLILTSNAYCAAAAREPASVVNSLLKLADPLGSGWALGDLDGDREADLVLSRGIGRSASGYLYRIELRLSQGKGSGSFTVASTNTLDVNIAVVDVDGDHDLDLVIDSRFGGQRIGVWIND